MRDPLRQEETPRVDEDIVPCTLKVGFEGGARQVPYRLLVYPVLIFFLVFSVCGYLRSQLSLFQRVFCFL